MKRTATVAIAIGSIAGFLWAPAAAAVPTTFTFAGDVLFDSTFGLGVGDGVSGEYTFESTAPDLNGDMNLGRYAFVAPSAFEITLGASVLASANFEIFVGASPIPGADQYSVLTQDASPGNRTVSVGLFDGTGGIADDSLPTTPPALAPFGIREISVRDPGGELLLTAELTDLSEGGAPGIPEPGAFLLYAAGVALLAGRRARATASNARRARSAAT